MKNDLERKELFEKYSALNEELEYTKKHLALQVATRSLIVKEIYENYGVGPFKHKGIYMTISSRTNKLTGEDTYYFKSPSATGVEEI